MIEVDSCFIYNTSSTVLIFLPVKWENEIQYLKEIGKLRVKEDLVKKMRKLKESKGDEWRDIKDSLDREIDQLKKSVDDTVSILK